MSSAAVRKSEQGTAKGPSPSLACVILSANGDIVIPATAHSLAGFRTWATSDAFPERGRISFLDREIVLDMSPEELETHAKVKMEVTRVLANLNRRSRLGELYPDGTLVTNVTANVSTEPDCTFATWATLESGLLRPAPREDEQGQYLELEGTPDWVLEIVSKSSVRKDTRVLRQRYHQAGIAEYWLIDARAAEIDFQILVREATDYHLATTQRGWQASPVFGRRFRLTRRRNRLGFWEYTLQVKALA